MNIRTTLITSSLIAASLVSGAAQAALIGRELNGLLGRFEAYYDDDLNITWLAQDITNPTNNMPRNWAAANTWAANISFTDGVNTYDNWRLPTNDTCFGVNCTGSEMGHLFYSELGGTAHQSILTSSDPDLAKFYLLQDVDYWSATEYAPNDSGAWAFNFRVGGQYRQPKGADLYALAVSPGDVGATNSVPDDPDDVGVVPEPATLLLVGLGLAGLGALRRRG